MNTALLILGSLATISASVATIVGVFNRQRLGQVHTLVNSKMSEALATIEELTAQLAAEKKAKS